jgi:mRNA-degrading endonuclease RelE of RelBE toxin-antitoxin system
MIKVILTPAFNHALKQLHKRYPHILQDIEPLIVQLENGETPGDRIQGLSYRVYKVRLKNRDSQRGKSGGYRTVYYVESAEKVAVVTIYSKSDQSDIPLDVLRQIIAEYAAHPPRSNE